MKRLKNRLAAVICAVLVLSLVPTASAAQTKILLSNAKTVITSDTAISDIRDVYGNEKLKTASIFGGSSYTFYGADYSDYLFIETNSRGRVAAYCTFGSGFKSAVGNFGDKAPDCFSTLSGDTFTDGDGNIWGVVGYCSQNIDDVSAPMLRYNSEARYAEYIARHAVLMWNCVSRYYGKTAELTFDSKSFYTNRQLMDGDSSFYEYCAAVGKSEQFKLVTCSSVVPYMLEYGAYYPNPGMYASYARGYTLPKDSYPVFDCHESGGFIVGAVRKTYYSSWKHVPYTQEETVLLSRARELYAASVSAYNGAFDYFDVHPQDESLPLTPGKIAQGKLYGALGYINSIRAAADLPLLELSESLSEGCQHKAVLTSYLSKNGLSNPSPHFPPQPDGISDDFYAKAQSGSGENLYHGNVIASITNALNDAYGDPVTYGHRYNLLEPTWEYIGFGSTEIEGQLSFGIQGVHKMSGNRQSNAELVAWPSKGVMLSEAGSGSNTVYTARFDANYSFTESSGVIFKCLNTGEKFIFSPNTPNTESHALYNGSGILSYYDANISMTVGNVYEITLTEVKRLSDGQTVDYTYRSVYESAYGSPSAVDNRISLSKSEITLSVNRTEKLSAQILPVDSDNKMVTWLSSNTDIASVNENGYVTAHSCGTVTVSAVTDSGSTAYCTVNVTATPFTDLTLHWYVTYIEAVYRHGIMMGMSDTTFEPQTGMDRAMFVKVLANLEGIDTDNYATVPFTDVKSGQYYVGPVAWAVKCGIVKGISPTEFAPKEPITREQMCAMLVRYAEYKSIALRGDTEYVPFEDEAAISDYAREYVKLCRCAGIIDGMTPTVFEPKSVATRAQVAKIFSIFFNFMR